MGRGTIKRSRICAVAGLLALVGSGTSAAKPPRDESTILVKYAQASAGKAAVQAKGDQVVAETKTKVLVVKLRPGASVDRAVADYAASPGVAYAEPNYIARILLAAPNDPGYAQQWAYSKIGALGGWAQYPGAYGGGGAPLAVVDTGVQASHPDLFGQVLTSAGANCLTGACVSNPANDDNGHGTHVAGIAGASTNNLLGVAGTAFSSPIVPVKAVDSTGSGTYASVAGGIVWAADHGARAINLSLGGGGYSQTLCDAVTYALSHGALVVAAAGNSATSAASYPAACPGAVGVAATDANDLTPYWSDYGYPDVFVSAPGVNIYSTFLGSMYVTLSGTSMATPFVTGLAALLFGEAPSRTPSDVKTLLATTSDKVGSGSYGSDPYGTCGGCTWNAKYGYGRIDLARALSTAAPQPDFTLSASPGSAGVAQSGGNAVYTVSVGAQSGFAGNVDLSVSGLPAGANAAFAPATVAAPGSSQLTVTVAAGTAAATYPLTITGGGSATHTTSVNLVVNSPANFGLSISPGLVTVLRGHGAAYTVSVSSLGGFAGAVSLSVSGVPGGASATFTPNPIAAPGSSTLRVYTTFSTVRGTFTLTVTGGSGGVTHTGTTTLVVR